MKLTRRQRELLSQAVRLDGLVPGRRFPATIEILADAGLIHVAFVVLDPAERAKLEAHRDEWIRHAEGAAGRDWKNARRNLNLAHREQEALDAVAWRITDAGRKAVEP